MPVQINWENPEYTIVRMELIGRWTWDEVYEGSKVGFSMLESVDHVVNVIIDLRQSTALPLLALTHARNMIPHRHPRTGMTVFIGTNTLFLSLWKIFSSAYSQFASTQEFTVARTLDDAYLIFATQPIPTVQPS